MLGHLRLAASIARRYAGRGESIEDLRQVAALALVKASQRFDPDRGVAFSTYASKVITGELRRHFRDATWRVSAPRSLKERYVAVAATRDHLTARWNRCPTVQEIARELRLADEDVLEALAVRETFRPLPTGDAGGVEVELGGDDPRLEGVDDRVSERADTAMVLSWLDPFERDVVELYYLCGFSQEKVGRRLGVSQVKVSRTLARIRNRLRPLASDRDAS